MRKIPMYTRKKKMQYQNMLTRIKALQLKEYDALYGEPEQSCNPLTSVREALRIGALI